MTRDARRNMTAKAKAFAAANQSSLVVEGSLHTNGECTYRLENGLTFKLTSADLKSMPDQPKWKMP